MSAYFSNLPNTYVAEVTADGKVEYKLTKNIFRRVILVEKLRQYTTAFESYYIPEGMRPDMLAHKFYGDSELDWIILLGNNITDIYSQWPRDTNQLLRYIDSIYEDPQEIHHWETNEIVLPDGTVYVKSGIIVNEDYRVIMPDKTTLTKSQSIYSVSNYEHEVYLNDKKRLIALPTSSLVEFFEEQFADLVDYKPNREVDNNGNKKTVNNIVSQYIDRSSFTRTNTRSSSAIGGVAGTGLNIL